LGSIIPFFSPNNHHSIFVAPHLIFVVKRCTNRLHHGHDLAGAGALSFTKATLGLGAQ